MSFARIQHFLSELKHRHVFRVAGLYAVVAWAAVQVATTIFPVLELPRWTVKLVVVLAILGFPVALALAWAFDLQVTAAAPANPSAAGASPGVQRERSRDARLWRVLATLLIVIVGAGGWASWRARRAAASRARASPALVAVLPFDVSAGGAEGYLRDGMVSLLAARLDGAGGLRSVDPQALLRSSLAEGLAEPDAARRMALHFGAGLFVLGSVVGGGARIQVAASLYETARRNEPVATASAEGPADSVFGIVDRIAIQLLSARAGPGERGAGTAALTTGSLPALKAFLEGERAFREARIGPAVEAYTRAVTLDTTFALAYSRLSNASNWHHDDSLVVWASSAAERHAARLPPRYRELVAADAAFLRGDPDVEERLRQILTRYPQDAEVWYRLGEVLYHRNWIRGRSSTEARRPFEQALALDPGNEMYVGHLRVLACLEGRIDDLARLPPPPVPDSLNPVVTGPLADGTLVALAGPAAERERMLERLAAAGDETFFTAVQMAIVCAPPETLAPLFSLAEQRSGHEDEWWMSVRLLERARGRWAAAERAIRSLRTRDPLTGTLLRAEGLLDPLRAPGADELLRARTDLLALDAAAGQGPDSLNTVPAFRLYRLGMLATRLGDPQQALAYADRLERLPPLGSRELVPLLITLLRTDALARAGRRAEALGMLERFDAQRWIGGGMIPGAAIWHSSRLRWLRAELLRDLGREREALGWYVTLTENEAPVDGPYLAPAHLRLAQIQERMGEKKQAAHSYRRVIALWHDADPEVQPLVHDAEQRLAALEAESSPGRMANRDLSCRRYAPLCLDP